MRKNTRASGWRALASKNWAITGVASAGRGVVAGAFIGPATLAGVRASLQGPSRDLFHPLIPAKAGIQGGLAKRPSRIAGRTCRVLGRAWITAFDPLLTSA